MSNLRVMCYNIYLGGKDNRFGNRLSSIESIIKKCQPDILALTEATGFNYGGYERLYAFERSLHMRGILAEASSNRHVALFIKPKHQIVKFFVDEEHFFHATLTAKLSVYGKFPLAVIVTHLNPFSPEARVTESQYLAYKVAESEHVLLMGDFNTFSPMDDIDSHLLDAFPPRLRACHGIDGIDFRPMKILYNNGFVDLYRHKNEHDDGYTLPTGLKEGTQPPMRVDYILGSIKISKYLLDCEVIKDAITEKASDHYPLQADFNLPT